MKRYLSFHDFFSAAFGEKIIKCSLDGNFSCPNRDGTLSKTGCLFCSERGSGDFAAEKTLSISEQILSQQQLLSKKWTSNSYIAYFQNFTNTYGSLEKMRHLYSQVLEQEEIVGLSIATRCDCLGEDVLYLLEELKEKTFLWLELGMQTVNEETLQIINRGYSHRQFDRVAQELKRRKILFLPHVIFGLPKETDRDFANSISYIKDLHPFGVKFHNLYLQKNSPLYAYYRSQPFDFLSKEEYIETVVTALKTLPRDMVIHRLTGDPDKSQLIAPKWCADKLSLLSTIDKELKEENIPLISEEELTFALSKWYYLK